MNFFAFFQLVFLICRDVAWAGVWIGKYGRTKLEMINDWLIGNFKPCRRSSLWVLRWW